MKNILEQRVYYADTDAYQVVWHGTYLRWLEMGRVELCTQLGLDLKTMQELDIVFPVTNINVKYKASAKLDDEIFIETWISKMSRFACTFSQIIKNKESDRIYITADVDVVAINNDGKLYRSFPENVKKCLEGGIVCNE